MTSDTYFFNFGFLKGVEKDDFKGELYLLESAKLTVSS